MSERPGYLTTLLTRFGEGWNRFWFTPSDPLPLGVLRIGVGLIALYLAATYGFDLRRFFDPNTGWLPLETILSIQQQNDRPVRFSIFDYATDGVMLQIFHYAGLAVLAAFVVGWKARISSIGAYVVFLSYFHRAPQITSEVEPVVACLLLYLCVGPCGAALSLDAWLRRRRTGSPVAAEPSYLATVSLRLIQVHTSLIYFLMFCGQLQGSAVWSEGTAVWWLIARPQSCLVNLRWLADAPYVVNFWTTAILLFEPAFSLLIWNRTARPLMVVLSGGMWLSIALLTGLIPFCTAMFVAGLAFISADTWRSRSLAPEIAC